MPYGIFICCLEIDVEKSVNMSPFDTRPVWWAQDRTSGSEEKKIGHFFMAHHWHFVGLFVIGHDIHQTAVVSVECRLRHGC